MSLSGDTPLLMALAATLTAGGLGIVVQARQVAATMPGGARRAAAASAIIYAVLLGPAIAGFVFQLASPFRLGLYGAALLAGLVVAGLVVSSFLDRIPALKPLIGDLQRAEAEHQLAQHDAKTRVLSDDRLIALVERLSAMAPYSRER